MKKSWWVIALVIVVLGAAAWWYSGNMAGSQDLSAAVANIDAQMQGLSSDQAQIQAASNDKPIDQSY